MGTKKSVDITYTDREQFLDILSPRRVLNDLDRQNAGAKLTRSKGGGRQRAASDAEDKQIASHVMEKQHAGALPGSSALSPTSSATRGQSGDRLSASYSQGAGQMQVTVIRLSPRTSESSPSSARISPRLLHTPSPALVSHVGSSVSASSPLLSPRTAGESLALSPTSLKQQQLYASTGGFHTLPLSPRHFASSDQSQSQFSDSNVSATSALHVSTEHMLHELYLATTPISANNTGRATSYHYKEPPINSVLEQMFSRDILTTEELLSLTQTNAAVASTVANGQATGKKSMRGLKKTFTTDSYFKLTGNYDGPYLPREKLKPSSWAPNKSDAETSASDTSMTPPPQQATRSSNPSFAISEPTHIISASTNVSSSHHPSAVAMGESERAPIASHSSNTTATETESTTTAISTNQNTTDSSTTRTPHETEAMPQQLQKQQPESAAKDSNVPPDSLTGSGGKEGREGKGDGANSAPTIATTRATRRGSKTVRRGSSKSKMSTTPTSASPSPIDSATNSPRGERGGAKEGGGEGEADTATTTATTTATEVKSHSSPPSAMLTSSGATVTVVKEDGSGKPKKKVMGRKISIGPIGGKSDKRDRGKSQEEHESGETPDAVPLLASEKSSTRPSMHKRKSLPNLLLGLMGGGGDRRDKATDKANEAGEEKATEVGKTSERTSTPHAATGSDTAQQQSTTASTTAPISSNPVPQQANLETEKGEHAGDASKVSLARVVNAVTEEPTTGFSSVPTGEMPKRSHAEERKMSEERVDDLSASRRDDKRFRENVKKEKEREKAELKEREKEKLKKRRSDKKRGKNVGDAPNLASLSVGNQQFAATNPQPRHRTRSMRHQNSTNREKDVDGTELTDVSVSKTLGGEGEGEGSQGHGSSESIDEVDLFSAKPSFFIRDIAGEVGHDSDFASLGLDGALKQKKRDEKAARAKESGDSTTTASSTSGSPNLGASSGKHSKDRRVIMSDLKRELHLDLLSSRKREQPLTGGEADELTPSQLSLAKSVKKEKEREEKREREEKKEKEREEKAMAMEERRRERGEQAASRRSEKALGKQGSVEHRLKKQLDGSRKVSERNITFLLLDDELVKVGIRPNNEILLIDPLVIAEVITMNEHMLFAKIPLTEFYHVQWKKPDKATRTPFILNLITWFNNVCEVFFVLFCFCLLVN
jgi:hypothetical protein